MTMRYLRHVLNHPRRVLQYTAACMRSGNTDPVLSASIGRVGSTILWQALVRSRAKHLMGSYLPIDWPIVSHGCWDLHAYRPRRGSICKTHDFPYDLSARHRLRTIFLFGTPSDAALSVYRCMESEGPDWIDDHFAHMHADGGFDALLKRDVLRMEEQIDAWRSVTSRKVLCLNYSALWDNVDLLSDFIGFPVSLPVKKERSFDTLPPELVAQARQAYARLDAKVAALPVCEIIG